MDRVDPRRTAIGNNNSRCAQNRDAAQNAQSGVPRFFSASSSPVGTEIVISISGAMLRLSQIASTCSRIILRGTGLMAGSPGGSGKPGFVKVPTPFPALNVTPLPVGPI